MYLFPVKFTTSRSLTRSGRFCSHSTKVGEDLPPGEGAWPPKVTEEPMSAPGIKSGLLILILVFLGITWTGGYLERERLPQAPGGIF